MSIDDNSIVGCLSDGCSSGRYTDIGARVQALSVLSSRSLDIDSITSKIVASKEILSIRIDDLLATLLGIVANDEYIEILMIGDGALYIEYSDHTRELVRVEYANESPYYPAYTIFNLQDEYNKLHEDNSTEIMTITSVIDGTSNVEVSGTKYEYRDVREVVGTKYEYRRLLETDSIRNIVLLSDGVSHISNVDWIDATLELTDFRSMNGEFLHRRMMKTLSRMRGRGSVLLDDISAVAIHNMGV